MAFSSGAAGSAGKGAVDEVSVQITNEIATSVYVKCLASSSNSVMINVPTLNAATWVTLEAGDAIVFRPQRGKASSVINAKATDNSNDATISWCVNGRI